MPMHPMKNNSHLELSKLMMNIELSEKKRSASIKSRKTRKRQDFVRNVKSRRNVWLKNKDKSSLRKNNKKTYTSYG